VDGVSGAKLFYRQLCAKEHGRDDIEVGEGDISASLQDGEHFPPEFSIQFNISLYISHMKLKWVVLFSIGGCITLKEP
jgi:hypothetical protein